MNLRQFKKFTEHLSDDTEMLLWFWDGEKGHYRPLIMSANHDRFEGYVSLIEDKYSDDIEPKKKEVRA